MKKEVSNYDFADSEFLSFQLDKNNLIVLMESWDAKILKILFSHTIQFSYKLGSIPKGIFEVNDKHPFLLEAVNEDYGYIPNAHPYKLFQIEDIEDFPFIQVVAERVEVFKLEKNMAI